MPSYILPSCMIERRWFLDKYVSEKKLQEAVFAPT